MTVSTARDSDSFKHTLETLFAQINKSDALERLRYQAWQGFLKLGLPTQKHEAYRHFKWRHLWSPAYQAAAPSIPTQEQLTPLIYPECRGATLVFVNGHYLAECSELETLPSKLEVCSLSEASYTFGTLLHNWWNQSLKEESDAWALLNMALHPQGAFLYVPPNTIVETPIQVLHLIDHQAPWPLLFPRLQLFMGAQAEARLIQVQRPLSGSPYGVSQVVACALEEGASLHYTQALCHEHPESWHGDAFRATLKRHSRLKTVCTTTGSRGLRTDYKVALNGEGAEALLNGLWVLQDQREAHVHILMDHQAPHCHSYQLFKGLLSGHSRSSFSGKILVRSAAQKTDAFQLNNNLLLSDQARANSKPNLEIFADDVKASHGSTVGQLDAEQLFYLRTRGYNQLSAQNLLVKAFCLPILELMQPAALSHEITTLIQDG